MKQLVQTSNQEVATVSPLNFSYVDKWLRFSAVTEKSVSTYQVAIKQLFKYFADNAIPSPNRENLIDWREALINSGKSAATINLYITAMKLFFRFLSLEGIYPNVADHIKGVRISHTHKRDTLNQTQAKKLVNSIDGDSLVELRNKAIVALMMTTGIRCVEVVRADVGDVICLDGGYFLRVQGKGHSAKDEMVRIAPTVKKFLDKYLSACGKVNRNAPLFSSTSRRNFGKRLQPQTISKMIKANLRGIGID